MKHIFQWPRRRLERHELLLGDFAAYALLYGFVVLAGEVMEGDTRGLDTRILHALRKADDPSTPIGPAWLQLALLDITALGGPTAILLVVGAVVGFLWLQTRYRTAMVVAGAAISGEVVNYALRSPQ